MNLFDIFLILIVLFFVIRGIFRGLIKEITSFIGVACGYYAAYSYYSLLARPLTTWVSHPDYCNILSFLIIFVAVTLIISILGVIIKYLLNISPLGWIDRACGAVLGFTKSVLILAVVLIGLTSFLPKEGDIVQGSAISPYILKISSQITRIAPARIQNPFLKNLKDLKNHWKNG
jgi:membrane protein required for colicin V production